MNKNHLYSEDNALNRIRHERLYDRTMFNIKEISKEFTLVGSRILKNLTRTDISDKEKHNLGANMINNSFFNPQETLNTCEDQVAWLEKSAKTVYGLITEVESIKTIDPKLSWEEKAKFTTQHIERARNMISDSKALNIDTQKEFEPIDNLDRILSELDQFRDIPEDSQHPEWEKFRSKSTWRLL